MTVHIEEVVNDVDVEEVDYDIQDVDDDLEDYFEEENDVDDLGCFRHKEIPSEINARLDSFHKFNKAGKDVVENGDFKSTEILVKRGEIYRQHIDSLLRSKETDAIESWMSCR